MKICEKLSLNYSCNLFLSGALDTSSVFALLDFRGSIDCDNDRVYPDCIRSFRYLENMLLSFGIKFID